MAEVDPIFRKLDGEDPRAFIASANLKRRNLSKGQQAMALAMMYPEPEKGGRGKKSEAKTSQKLGGFSAARLDQARAVLRWSRTKAEAVLAGGEYLDAVLGEMKAEQEQRKSSEQRAAELRLKAADLADLVDEGRMSLSDARGAMLERWNAPTL